MFFVSACGTRRVMPPKVALMPESASVFNEYRIGSGDILDFTYMFDISPVAYQINPGDRVVIFFPGARGLQYEQIVRPDGCITLSGLGDINIGQKTTTEASAIIEKKTQSLLQFPEANVQIVESRSALEDAVTTTARGSTRQYVVRPDGLLTLPALGGIIARGKSLETLTVEINSRYGQRWPSAKVYINLVESQGLQVYVLGEVNRPGNYKLSSMAVLPQALSLAGGMTREAAGDFVYIARLEDEVYEISRINIAPDFTDSTTKRLPLIAPNDIIYVPRSTLSQASQIMQEISSIFMFRGWGITLNYNLKDNNETDVDFQYNE